MIWDGTWYCNYSDTDIRLLMIWDGTKPSGAMASWLISFFFLKKNIYIYIYIYAPLPWLIFK
jgi:hypothetical protein